MWNVHALKYVNTNYAILPKSHSCLTSPLSQYQYYHLSECILMSLLKQFPLVLLQGRSLFLYIFLYFSFSCSWASDKVNLSSLIFFCSKLNLWDTSMMIFVSKVCSFWLPSNIALYDYISLPVFPLGDRIWVVYSFPLLWIKLLWIFVYRCLCKYTFSSLGGSNAQ